MNLVRNDGSGYFTNEVVEHRNLLQPLPVHLDGLMHLYPLDERCHNLIRQLRDI